MVVFDRFLLNFLGKGRLVNMTNNKNDHNAFNKEKPITSLMPNGFNAQKF